MGRAMGLASIWVDIDAAADDHACLMASLE